VSPVRIRFHPEADDEVAEAYRWYRARSPAAAIAFRTQIDRAIAQVADAPERPACYLHGTRRVLVRRFPFAIVYRIADDGIEIIAVAHGRCRPGYWSDR
jgi:plasmid stabilization system protein ParE